MGPRTRRCEARLTSGAPVRRLLQNTKKISKEHAAPKFKISTGDPDGHGVAAGHAGYFVNPCPQAERWLGAAVGRPEYFFR